MRAGWVLAFGTMLLVGCDDAGGADPGADADASGLELPPGLDAADETDEGGGPGDPPGLGIDYAALPAGDAPRFEPGGEGWTAVPWPNDRHRGADGSVDLTVFPNPEALDLLDQYIAYGLEVMRGYGLNGSVYFELGGPVDPETLPAPQVTLQDPKAPVQLVNVTPGHPRRGERMPLLFRFHAGDADPYYRPNTLAMRPVFGFPLAEGATYCAIVTRGVKDAQGRHLSPAAGFPAAIDTEAALAPLADWLADGSRLTAEDVAVATCFTTDRPTDELRRVRAFLDTQPLPHVTDVVYKGKANTFHEFHGHYVAPNFQFGVKPYAEQGGDLRFDAAGDPIVAEQEPIRFLLMIPSAYKMPETGWPTLLYAHGTGGDFESCRGDVDSLTVEAFAVICIDQPLHGERFWKDGLPTAADENEIVLYSFNFLNPRSGRTGFRQAAIDTMSLSRMIAGGALDLAAAETGKYAKDVVFDADNVHFFGHSHGGLSGAIALGVEPRLRSAVLSGAAGVLIETILRRKDPVDIAVLAQALLAVPEESFDSFHPVLTLIQTLVDATDPINYAPYWLDPATGGTPKHVFVTEGTEDHASPAVGTEAMAAAARIPLVEPVASPSIAHLLRGLAEYDLPVSLNATNGTGARLTAGLRQFPGGDHWIGLTDPTARKLWTSFFRAIRMGQAPVIGE